MMLSMGVSLVVNFTSGRETISISSLRGILSLEMRKYASAAHFLSLLTIAVASLRATRNAA